jgi:hypothetical protein
MSLDITLYKRLEIDSELCLGCLSNDKYHTHVLSIHYDRNITHNYTKMADVAGVYHTIWRPELLGNSVLTHRILHHEDRMEVTEADRLKKVLPRVRARQLTDALATGLLKLKQSPETYKALQPINGWGTYSQFVDFVEEYWYACRTFPDAVVEVSR